MKREQPDSKVGVAPESVLEALQAVEVIAKAPHSLEYVKTVRDKLKESPRAHVCTCSKYLLVKLQEPSEHAEGCPVAPAPGKHGGLRLWPETVKGAAQWSYCSPGTWAMWRYGHSWATFTLLVYREWLITNTGPVTNDDRLLMQWYLPPVLEESARVTPWAPYAEDY